MAIGSLINTLKNIMRGDSGVDGDAQRLSQIVWILFLKVFDFKEREWALDDNYEPIIPIGYRWRDWASVEDEDGKPDVKNQMTGDELIDFVNNKLFPVLRGDSITDETGREVKPFKSKSERAYIVKEFMADSTNYMKNGIRLRKVINEFIDLDFSNSGERHEFNDIYEIMLKDLQKKGTGEFYTPRGLTAFIVKHVNPQIGENIADFACGTGGFLVEALKYLQEQTQNLEDDAKVQSSLYGIEWKPLPYMLATTNLMLHGINKPNILHGNGLGLNMAEVKKKDKYKVILMNPPFGGNVDASDQSNFPSKFKSAESADLFIARILYCLDKNGRCGLILPDGFLLNDDVAKVNLREKLLTEFNLHTVIRLPKSCFKPYADVATNLLFFDNTGSTEHTWFYRMDMPEGYKSFSKTKPITLPLMKCIDEWWDNRVEIKDVKEDESMTETWKAQKVPFSELKENGYNLNYCFFPKSEDIIVSPKETINNYLEQREKVDKKIKSKIDEIMALLGE